MTVDYKAEFKELGSEYQGLRNAIPEVMKASGGLHKATMGDGVLPAKVKELIALGIGINMRCEGCVVSHARSAIRAGATMEEIGEAIGVSINLGGGPASVYGGKAYAAAEQFNAG